MSNSERAFMHFMVFFSGTVAILAAYLALWYWCQDILGTATLWLFLALNSAIHAYWLEIKLRGDTKNENHR